MGNCFKCFTKDQDDQDPLIDSDDGSVYTDMSSELDSEDNVPPSERDEVYKRLQDALIHYDPPDILGRSEVEEKLNEYTEGMSERIMSGIYLEKKPFQSPRSTGLATGDHNYGSGSSSTVRSHEVPPPETGDHHHHGEDSTEPAWQNMVNELREKIRHHGGMDKVAYVYQRGGN